MTDPVLHSVDSSSQATRAAHDAVTRDGVRAPAGEHTGGPVLDVMVREASVGDTDRVVPLFDAYRQFYGAVSDPAAARAFLAARQTRGESVLLLASRLVRDDAGEQALASPGAPLLGFAQLYASFSSVSLGPITILNDLFVLPAWRRGNVGRHLVLAAAAHAAQRGALRLVLSTQHTNTPARRLYESLGFAPDLEFTHMSLGLGASREVGERSS
jgi:ribosomal protein S18 acetylase RimI-like enzyme